MPPESRSSAATNSCDERNTSGTHALDCSSRCISAILSASSSSTTILILTASYLPRSGRRNGRNGNQLHRLDRHVSDLQFDHGALLSIVFLHVAFLRVAFFRVLGLGQPFASPAHTRTRLGRLLGLLRLGFGLLVVR